MPRVPVTTPRARRGFSALRATRSPIRGLLLVAACLALGACAAARATGVAPPPSVAPPLGLGGLRVLVAPVQRGAGVGEGAQRRLESELLFALAERDAQVTWVRPDELRNALTRAPGLAADPDYLPADRYLHQGVRRIGDPLLGQLRRYSALTDTRLILVPHRVTFVRPDAAPEGALRLDAALVDVRSGDLLWWGSAEAPAPEAGEAAAVARLAASLAARLLVPTGTL